MRELLQNLRLHLASFARDSDFVAPTFRSARAVSLSGRWGTAEGQLLASLARPGSIAIDVGANVGQYSAVLARALQGLGIVLAFEPNPYAYEALVKGCRKKLVLPLSCALSNRSGSGTLSVPLSLNGEMQIQLGSLDENLQKTGYERFSVVVEKLDTFLPILDLGVSVVKIDVEGFELEVLKGAEKLLTEQRPPLVIEIEHRHQPSGQSAEDVVMWLLDHGYEVCGLDPRGIIGWKEALRKQGEYTRGNGAHPAEYCNNFVAHPASVP